MQSRSPTARSVILLLRPAGQGDDPRGEERTRRRSGAWSQENVASDDAAGFQLHSRQAATCSITLAHRPADGRPSARDLDEDVRARHQKVRVAGLAPAATRSRTEQSTIEIHPGSDRRDSHPLGRGSRPRASTTSASITVRPGGIAPPSLGYRPRALLLSYGWERRAVRPRDEPAVRPAGGGWRVVGVVGFAPTASWSRTMRSGCWNYTPGIVQMVGFEPTATGVSGDNHLAAARGGPWARVVRRCFYSALPAELHLRGGAGAARVVGVAGIAPTASRSPTVRSHY